MRTFDEWEWSARLALGERGIGYHEATPLIEQARADYAETGQDPWGVLGSPKDFAADVAAARPAGQALRDTLGKTPRGYFSDAAFVVAFMGVMSALAGAFYVGGFTIPLTVAGVAGSLTAAAALFVAVAAPGALRAAGYPRLAPWGFALTGALITAAGFAFVELPRTRIGELPVLVLLAGALAACWRLTQPGPAPAATQDADSSSDPQESDAWYARMNALLIGRFDVTATRAADLVAQTRAHVTEAGTAPAVEFPSLAAYAHDLAQVEPVRRGPWWRSPAAALLAAAAVVSYWVYIAVEALLTGNWGTAILALIAAPLAVSIIRKRFRVWTATR